MPINAPQVTNFPGGVMFSTQVAPVAPVTPVLGGWV
jgi:hypothetical protein